MFSTTNQVNSLTTKNINLRIKEILSINPENNFCFDCNNGKSDYINLIFAIFLCSECGDKHRELFCDFKDRIMPIEKSNWSENDLNYLNLGGNSRLKEFMSIYNFPLNETGDNKTNLENKYLRKGILEYIKDLVNKLEGKQIKEININKESALKKINLVELNETVFSLCLKNEHFLKEKIYIDTCNYNIKDGGSLFKNEKQ